MARTAKIERSTLETDIKLELNLDGEGQADLQTGVPFLEHMLSSWCRHGFFNLTLRAGGDLEEEPHHLVEDIGLSLGRAFSRALGDKKGIKRFGSSIVPMDDALVLAAADLSGRPFLYYDINIAGTVAALDPELFQEFWQAFTNEARITLHLKLYHGTNKHHIMEAVFKAAGRALDEASSCFDRFQGILSTKGKLD